VSLLPNQSTEFLSQTCPRRPGDKDELVCASCSVLVYARLIDPVSGEVIARYADWPQPFRYLDFPDPQIQIARLASPSRAEITVQKPAKCVVLSIRNDTVSGDYKGDASWGENVKWGDNALDLFPGDKRTIDCSGWDESKEIWAAYMGHEKAFKLANPLTRNPATN